MSSSLMSLQTSGVVSQLLCLPEKRCVFALSAILKLKLLMDEREFDFTASLLLQNEELRREVEDLKTVLVMENLEVRSRLDRDTIMEKHELRAC